MNLMTGPPTACYGVNSACRKAAKHCGWHQCAECIQIADVHTTVNKDLYGIVV